MKKISFQQILALLGVALILLLFILTLVFILIGNSTLAITFVAINGFVVVVLYFTLRFHQHAKDANKEWLEHQDSPTKKD
jgi:c-di-AMP phosphodiesterase-like protein